MLERVDCKEFQLAASFALVLLGEFPIKSFTNEKKTSTHTPLVTVLNTRTLDYKEKRRTKLEPEGMIIIREPQRNIPTTCYRR